MNEESARQYGQYVRHLFMLSRAGDSDSVDLFLAEMECSEAKDILRLMIQAGGQLIDDD